MTIESNYVYNKSKSNIINSYIYRQNDSLDNVDGIVSSLHFGNTKFGPNGCGIVATYNALIMLGNRIEICDIIRDYEMNHIYHYGLIGTHGNNIARYFRSKGYNVTITNLENYDFNNNYDLSTVSNIVTKNPANILYYKSSGVGHFIAIKYMGKDSNNEDVFVTYNENTNNGVSNSIKDFIPGSNQPYMLISISNK